MNFKDVAPHQIDQYAWAYEIMKFFQIPQIYHKEKKSAVRIENFIKQVKKIKVKDRFNELILQLKDMKKNLQDLP